MHKNHGHFHAGDAGLDLFIIENQIIIYCQLRTFYNFQNSD